jgi:hypothetical protein
MTRLAEVCRRKTRQRPVWIEARDTTSVTAAVISCNPRVFEEKTRVS